MRIRLIKVTRTGHHQLGKRMVDVAEEFGLDIPIREVAEEYFIKNNAVWESENPESLPKRRISDEAEEKVGTRDFGLRYGKEDSGERLSAVSGERATFRIVDFSFWISSINLR
jgi:hypothetical protein